MGGRDGWRGGLCFITDASAYFCHKNFLRCSFDRDKRNLVERKREGIWEGTERCVALYILAYVVLLSCS